MFLSESSFPITEKLGHQKYRHLFKKNKTKNPLMAVGIQLLAWKSFDFGA